VIAPQESQAGASDWNEAYWALSDVFSPVSFGGSAGIDMLSNIMTAATVLPDVTMFVIGSVGSRALILPPTVALEAAWDDVETTGIVTGMDVNDEWETVPAETGLAGNVTTGDVPTDDSVCGVVLGVV